MEVEIKRVAEVSISVGAALTYSFLTGKIIPKGFLRLLSLLPVFLLFSLIPLRLTAAFNAAVATLYLTWLANLKLLLFAFGSGPLCPCPDPNSINPPLSLPLFFAFSLLSVRPNHNSTHLPKTELNLNLATELVIFPVLISVVHNRRDFLDSIHPKFILGIYCIQLFLLVDVLIAVSNLLAGGLFGLELQPPSNQPYLATSLQDFWGRRWNLMVTNNLRITVYNPVRSFVARVVGDSAAMAAGVMAAFLVSGLMHELLFFYVSRVKPTWEMTGFFVLQGVCVVVEFRLKKAVGKRVVLPAVVSTPMTVGFVVATSFWLFFPPIMNSGADMKIVAEFSWFLGFVENVLPSSLVR